MWDWHQLLLNSSGREEEGGGYHVIRFPDPLKQPHALEGRLQSQLSVRREPGPGFPGQSMPRFPLPSHPFAALTFTTAATVAESVGEKALQKWLGQLSRTWALKSSALLAGSCWFSKSSPFWWGVWSVSVPKANFSSSSSFLLRLGLHPLSVWILVTVSLACFYDLICPAIVVKKTARHGPLCAHYGLGPQAKESREASKKFRAEGGLPRL